MTSGSYQGGHPVHFFNTLNTSLPPQKLLPMTFSSSFFSLRKTLASAVFVISVLTLCIGLPLFLFETRPGNLFLLKKTAQLLKKYDFRINKGTLQGSFPRDFTLGSFSYGPPQSPLVQGKNLHIQFKWTDLFRGRITFPLVHMTTLKIAPSSSPSPSSSLDIPSLMEAFQNSLSDGLSFTFPLLLSFPSLIVDNMVISYGDSAIRGDLHGSFFLPRKKKNPIQLNVTAHLLESGGRIEVALSYIRKDSLLTGHIAFLDEASKLLKTVMDISGHTSLRSTFSFDLSRKQFVMETQGKNTEIGSFEGTLHTTIDELRRVSNQIDLHLTTPFLDPITPLDPTFHLTASILLKDYEIRLAESTFSSPLGKFSASGFYNAQVPSFWGTLEGTFVIPPDLFPHGCHLIAKQFPSFFSSSQEHEGWILPFSFNVKRLNKEDIDFSGKLGHSEGMISLEGQYTTSSGKISSRLQAPDHKQKPALLLISEIDTQTGYLTLPQIVLHTPSLTLQGSGKGPIAPFLPSQSTGEIIFSLHDLELLGLEDTTGRLEGRLSLHEKKGIEGTLTGKDIQFDGRSLKTLTGSFLVPWVSSTPLSGSLALTDVFLSQAFHLTHLSLEAKGHLRDKDHPVLISLKGKEHQTKRLGVEGSLFAHKECWKGTIHNLFASIGSRRIHQKDIATFSSEAKSFTLSHLLINMGKGSLGLSITYDPHHVKGDLEVTKFPLEAMNLFEPSLSAVPMDVTGKASLSGTPSSPNLFYEFNFATVTKTMDSFLPKDSVSAHTTGQYDGHTLKTSLDAHVNEDSSQSVSLKAILPVAYTPPFAFVFRNESPLSVLMKGRGSIESFGSFFLHPSFVVAGQVITDFSLGGTVKNPTLQGHFTLENGMFSSYETGTLLDNISLLIRAQEGFFFIDKLKASDGKEGCLEGNGNLSLFFLSPKAPSYAFTLKLKNFLVAAIDLVTATATGEVKCYPDPTNNKPVVSGKLTLDPISVHIPKRLPDSLTTLPIAYTSPPIQPSLSEQEDFSLKKLDKESQKRFHIFEVVPPTASPAGPSDAPSLLDAVLLDVSVAIPPRFSIDGWGLQSLWEGNVTIFDKLSDPALKGSVTLVKGTFTILSRTLTLDKGVLTFTGKKGFDPDLLVRASVSTGDIFGHVIMKGTLMDPQFALTSEPAFSESEIISQILFGKSVGSLSPFQSLQIVTALGELSGTGSPLGLVHQFKNTLGLGALNFTTGNGANQGPGVSLEKDVTDEITVDIQQGVTPESTKASAQIKLFPQVILESDIDATSAVGVGLNWRLDY